MGSSTSLSRRAGRCSLLSLLLLLSASAWAWGAEKEGSVVDKQTGAPVSGATITSGDQMTVSDADGKVSHRKRRVRASWCGPPAMDGSRPSWRMGIARSSPSSHCERKGSISPSTASARPSLRNPALDVMKAAGLNTLVIDVKGDRGLIPYASKVPLAAEIGATKVRTIGDLAGLVAQLKAKGIYTIGRIVVFKDTLLAQARPQWAIQERKWNAVARSRRACLDRSLPDGGPGLCDQHRRGGRGGRLRRDPVRLH